jgi:hypothetical protein
MEKLDKKTFIIGVLSLSAVVLFVANLIQPPRAEAQMSIKDRDYQAVTARVVKGGEALYLTDNRTGKMAVFIYDPNKRAVVPVASGSIGDIFGGGAPAGPGGNPPRRGAR